MELNQDRINTLGQRISARNLTERHQQRTRQEYETIFGIEPTPEAGRANLDLVFKRVIQARANPLNRSTYLDILDSVSPETIIGADTHEGAFDALREQPHIGQKIANEFLRHVVDVFSIKRDAWRDQLHVALDTNVVQALVKTGGIVVPKTERDRGPNQLINMNPNSTPRKLIGYQAVQDALERAADAAGFSPIVFDELWLEHRTFITDPLLQSESAFSDLILDHYQY